MIPTEVLFEVLEKLTGAIPGFHLPIAKDIANREQRFLEDIQAESCIFTGPVIPIRKMKRINIPIGRRIISFDDLLAKLIGRADESSAGLPGSEKRILIHLTSRGIMNDVTSLDP